MIPKRSATRVAWVPLPAPGAPISGCALTAPSPPFRQTDHRRGRGRPRPGPGGVAPVTRPQEDPGPGSSAGTSCPSWSDRYADVGSSQVQVEAGAQPHPLQRVDQVVGGDVPGPPPANGQPPMPPRWRPAPCTPSSTAANAWRAGVAGAVEVVAQRRGRRRPPRAPPRSARAPAPTPPPRWCRPGTARQRPRRHLRRRARAPARPAPRPRRGSPKAAESVGVVDQPDLPGPGDRLDRLPHGLGGRHVHVAPRKVPVTRPRH